VKTRISEMSLLSRASRACHINLPVVTLLHDQCEVRMGLMSTAVSLFNFNTTTNISHHYIRKMAGKQNP